MKCPGQDSRYWKPGAIFEVTCPKCGAGVEFFKDDTSRKCGYCGHRFVNPHMDFGCAAYCEFAEQCIGTLPPEMVARQENLLKDRVAVEMKRYFGRDFKRIGHAGRVARYAEQIAKAEKGNLAVILTSAYLHDIGIKAAEQKYQSTAARYQEAEGPPIAREMLTKLGAPAPLIEEVCDIIGHHHHPRENESTNFKSLYDADMIVNLEEQHQVHPMDAGKLDRVIEKNFLTKTGSRLARQVILSES